MSKRLYDQPITNFPTPQWLREVDDEDFVSCAEVAAVSVPTVIELPAAASAGQPVLDAGMAPPHETLAPAVAALMERAECCDQ